MRCHEEQYVLSPGVRRRARRDTRQGVQVVRTPEEIVEQLDLADRALNGESNDAEHDALYRLREWLSGALEGPGRRTGG